ncbi:MAG: hypothetical protein K5891_09475 [Lachnospiraceae bacterium]|nr:hypothetical protein [Lachnospiraceae bacterium]
MDLAYVYRDDPERMSEELREATIEDDPSLFLKRLTYDGTTFLTEPLHKVDGEYVVHEEVGYDSPAATWQCLMHYEGESPYEFSLFTYYDIYVLTNRDDVTWEELQWGMLSSTAGDYIPFEQIYGEYTWREEAEQQ